jgi:hypothetical protein
MFQHRTCISVIFLLVVNYLHKNIMIIYVHVHHYNTVLRILLTVNYYCETNKTLDLT